MADDNFSRYFNTLAELPRTSDATDRAGESLPLETALRRAMEMARTTHRRGNKLMFIGNGGSAAIASHMAIDYSKNGGMRSLAFNDPAALTCLGNDHGYEHVFAKQLEFHAVAGDFLIAISSSGRSENIIRGVEMARSLSCQILTLTSFNGDNPLRRLGDLNIYVATSAYGFAEISHLTLCHAILDRAVELSANRTLAQQQELV